MSPPLEHDYIGLSEIPSAVAVAGGGVDEGSLNLEATELRLGLPGSESPDRKDEVAHTLELLPKSFASGSKRGFADAIDSDGKWGGEVGSEADLGKGGGLFSPRGEMAAAGGGHLAGQGNAGKDAVVSPVGQEKKAAAQAGGSVGHDRAMAPAAKQQVVGWPPIRSYRKNNMASSPSKNKHEADGKQGLGCLYVKVSMDGAPYLRKVDLKMYNNYKELSSALEKMFSCFTIGQCGSHGMPCKDGFSERHLMDLLNVSEYVVTYEDKDGDWMLVGDVPWEMFTDSCRRLRVMKGSDAIGLAPRAMEKCKSRN